MEEIGAKSVMSEESAYAQVQAFLDYYEIERAEGGDESAIASQSTFDAQVKTLVGAIRKGRLEIDTSDGTPVVTQFVTGGKAVKWGKLNGNALVATDGAKGAVGKMAAMAGSLTNLGTAWYGKLEGKDLSTANAVVSLFLLI